MLSTGEVTETSDGWIIKSKGNNNYLIKRRGESLPFFFIEKRGIISGRKKQDRMSYTSYVDN